MIMEAALDKNYLEQLQKAIQQADEDYLEEQLQNLYAVDLAQALKYLEDPEARYLFQMLTRYRGGEVLTELEEEQRKGILTDFSAQQIVDDYIKQMDSDDAADFINSFPESSRDGVIDYLSKSNNPSDRAILALLAYDPETAGGLMATELIRVNENWSVAQCQTAIRNQAKEIESIYTVFVEDDKRKLKGYIPLTSLILTEPEIKIHEIYNESVVSVIGNTPAEEVASVMQKYDLVALPVVNKEDILIGRITIDDVVDFIKGEAEEDYQLASGIAEDVGYADRVWVLSRARLPWLLLGLLGGVSSAKVISLNEGALEIYPQMAFFIPLIAAMGGNAGIQSSAIIVQGLASNTLLSSSYFAKILKELAVSLMNGLLCAAVLLGYSLLVNQGLQLALTVSLSLFVVIITASLLGVSIPLLMERLNIDPALATGPFITTTNDLIGLGIYFLVGRLIYSIPL